ncbi:hypothetical protein ACHAWC_010596 [Mediolabrus comicus]
MLPSKQYYMRPQDPGGGSDSLGQGGNHQSSSCGGGGGSHDRSLVNVSLSLVRSTDVPSDEDLRQIGWSKAYDMVSRCYYYFTLDRSKIVWENPLTAVPSDEDLRRIGWGKAYDIFSRCYYYFTLDHSTRVWENPLTLSSVQDVDVRAHHYDDQRDVSGEATKRRRKRSRKRKTSSRVGSHDDETRASGGEKLVELELDEFGRYSRGRSRDRSVDFPSHFRKRWRSPDSTRHVEQNKEVNRSRRQKIIGEDLQLDTNGDERRPLGSINGSEMQRAAPHPMTPNGSRRNDDAATLSLGRNGVNNMSSHQNHHHQLQYHQYHHPMDSSQRRPLASSQKDSLFRPPQQPPQFNKINTMPELIQTAYSSLSAMSMSPSDTAAFWNSVTKQLGRNNQLNLSSEQMGCHIKQLFEHTLRTLTTFGMKDLTQTTYSMAKLVASLRKLGSSRFYRKDHIASLLSNLLLNDDGIREDLFLSLANASVYKMDQFDARHLSNLAYAYALIRFVPVLIDGRDLFYHVAKAAIQRKEDFNSQQVANLLWSYAKMGIVDEQLFLFSSFAPIAAKLIDNYNNQNLANIAWAYAVADIDSPVLFNDRFINKCVEKRDGFSIEELSQLHQWHLWQTKEKSRTGLSEALQDICYRAFTSQSVHPSKFQEDVVSQLSSIGLDPKEEALMDSGYRIDALVEVNGKIIGVEVDGPSHFVGKSKSPTGSTIMKREQVQSIDEIDLVSVPYWEWNKLGKDQGKQQDYLRRLLNL